MAPKPMKALKVLQLHLKRFSAQTTLKGEGMSLEEKMEMFEKRNNMGVNSFLDGLQSCGKGLTQPRRSSWATS